MRKQFIAGVLIVLASLCASAQQPISTSQLQLPLADPPQMVQSGSAQRIGNPGNATYFYWIVSKYTIGNSSPAGPFAVSSVATTLSSSNYVQISWQPPTTGLTFDVLRTTSPAAPTGACACAVATAVSGTSTNDQSNSLSAYTVSSLDPASLVVTQTNESSATGIGELTFRANLAKMFGIRTDGATRIRGVLYTWPASQAAGTRILQNDGAGNLSWATGGGGGTPSVPFTSVQFNDAGTFLGDAGFTFNKTSKNLSIVSMEAIRFADQFTAGSVGAQIDAACADLAGAQGTVVIPSTMGAGWSLLGIVSNCNIVDWRGIGGSTQTAYARGVDYYGRYTSVGPGLQIVSPMLIEWDAYSGGVNDILSTKTQWQGIRIQGIGRTIGERKGLQSFLFAYGKGDAIGLMGTCYNSGGYGTGGDEGCEGVRGGAIQGNGNADGGFPRGTVSAVAGNLVTGSWTAGTNAGLGEQRPLINTSRGVYSTGTIASATTTTPCTITGTGTAWLAGLGGAGAKSDLFLNITANDNGTVKWVVPITSVTDDTHLVIEYNENEIGASCIGSGLTTSGAYNVYKGGNVASLAAPPSGSLSATAVNLTAGGTNFVAGDTIQQPLGYNHAGYALYGEVNKLVGGANGAGVRIANTGSIAAGDAFYSTGAFGNGVRIGGATTGSIVEASTTYGKLISAFDQSAVVQRILHLLSTGGSYRGFDFDRPNDNFIWSGGQYFSGGDQRFGIGTMPQANILGYLYWNNSAWTGVAIEPAVAANAGLPYFRVRKAGATQFDVEELLVNFASSTVAKFYSDDRVTQTASISAATGASTFGSVTSTTTNPASAGFERLAKTDAINIRNNGNTADVNAISLNASDQVVVGGSAGVVLGSGASPGILNIPTGACPAGTAGTAGICSAVGDILSYRQGVGSPLPIGVTTQRIDQNNAATTSAQFLSVISDESGTGVVMGNNTPTILTPAIASMVNANHNHQTAAGGGTLDAAAIAAGTLGVARGGTGTATNTVHGVLVGNAASAINATSAGTVGQVLNSNGASADPTFGDGIYIDWQKATSAITGTGADATVYSVTIPYIPAGRCVVSHFDFNFSTATAVNKNIKIKVGTQAAIASGAVTTTSNSNSYIEAQICNDPGVQNARTITLGALFIATGFQNSAVISTANTDDSSAPITLLWIFNAAGTEAITGRGSLTRWVK
ncbi:MAG: hypothetical protein JWO13_838 [Acidobacteriales bacterium]|nr:hypothetical protein [Terriglobales bacterium]